MLIQKDFFPTMEARITLISKPDQNITRKPQTNISRGHPSSICHKISANDRMYTKKYTHHDYLRLIPDTQD
jgi:hypothetical protein